MKKELAQLRTWIEIDASAAKRNYAFFRKLIGKKVKLWAVVKSNAYGHGLFTFSKLMASFGVDGFCVDSEVEGVALRKAGIKKPILVLGSTLPARLEEAAKNNITVSVSNMDALRALARVRRTPDFHIKIDTGFHRQGFYVEEIPKVIAFLNTRPAKMKNALKGVFTHFSSAKDINYPTYTDQQLKKFKQVIALFEKAGFKKLIKHASATGGTLIDPQYHLDAVRVGIGLYGLWPSKELEIQLGDKIKLYPVLSWRAFVSEVKKLKAGDYVGYDLTERVPRAMTMALLPLGYWHGFPRSLSSSGVVLVKGKRARVLGRVSMDITAIAPGGPVKAGAIATLIGKDGKDEVAAWELAQRSGTSTYEAVTRLNPLMERVIIK